MKSETIVCLNDVVRQFTSQNGVLTVLNRVSFSVAAGEFVGIVGASGSGKTTLLNILTGIDRPTFGTVEVLGQKLEIMPENALARWRGRNIGIVFQFFQLLPTLTALENVMLPMQLCRIGTRRERQEQATYCLERVGMADYAHKLPNMLSGGQQQRIAVARALVNDPPLIVADEPTGNLDSHSSGELFSLFQQLTEKGKTVILVTHDRELSGMIPRLVELFDGTIRSAAQQLIRPKAKSWLVTPGTQMASLFNGENRERIAEI